MKIKFIKSLIVFLCLLITVSLLILPLATRVRVSEEKEYFSAERVALYLYEYGHLPSNFLTKEEAEEKYGKAYLCIAEGYNIGGDVFSAERREDYADWIGNYSQKREFFECDIYPDRAACIEQNTRGGVRLVYSADYKEVYYTDNHYGQYEAPGFRLLDRYSLNAVSNSLWIAFGAVCAVHCKPCGKRRPLEGNERGDNKLILLLFRTRRPSHLSRCLPRAHSPAKA